MHSRSRVSVAPVCLLRRSLSGAKSPRHPPPAAALPARCSRCAPGFGEIECSYSTIVGRCPAMPTSEMGPKPEVAVPCGGMSAPPRILLQKSKVASVRIFGETLNAERSTIQITSVALPKSPMSLAWGDEVPQIFTRKTRLRPSEFLTPSANRLLQHYPRVSGHRQAISACPKGANSGSRRPYSTTSSASASIAGGLPSSLANHRFALKSLLLPPKFTASSAASGCTTIAVRANLQRRGNDGNKSARPAGWLGTRHS
jgi:hypothetical protein